MNSQMRIAATRYAAAYDRISTSTQQAEKNAQQLNRAMEILSQINGFLQSPRLSAVHKKLVLNEVLKDVPQAARFVEVLIDAKRYNLLPEICKQVHTFLDDRKGISRAIVTSARVLNAAQQQATQKALSSRYGKVVQATFRVDPALLGGLTAQCNGELIDGSIKTRLEKLQKQITQ